MIVIIIIIIDDDNRRRPHLSGDVGVDHVDLLGEVDDAPAPSSSPAAYYYAHFGKLPLCMLVDCVDAFRRIALSHVLFVDSLGRRRPAGAGPPSRAPATGRHFFRVSKREEKRQNPMCDQQAKTKADKLQKCRRARARV